MKKYLMYIIPLIFIIIIFFYSKNVYASSSATVFIGEPIVLDSYENVEITYNNVEINEETSEIKNTQLYTNLSDKTVTRKASIKLEDSYSNLTINSLRIMVNDLEIKEITKENDNYIFYFQINPNEGKKIEISYKTDSSLQDAKIIKYTMDKLKGNNIKLFYIKIILSKYDIPLVQKIWPGAYELEENTVSTEYVDFTINNLTSTFIMQKDTYRNIKYGEYSDSLSDIDEYILEHYKEFIDGTVPEIPYKDIYDSESIITKWMNRKRYNYWDGDRINESLLNVINHVLITKAHNDGKVYYTNEYSLRTTLDFSSSENYCITDYITNLYKKDFEWGEYNEKNAVGKMVAIHYYETEQGKDLYVNKDTTNSKHSVDVPKEKFVLTKRDEYSILRTNVSKGAPNFEFNRGILKVFVNSDIDGNKIDITEDEILDFVNMMNVDLYIRIVIYDPSNNYPNVYAGYYIDETKDIADEYTETKYIIKSYEDVIKNVDNEYTDSIWSNLTEEEKKNLRNQELERYKKYIEDAKKRYKKFDNETVSNKAKVPTLAHCIATCRYEDGKYLIEFDRPTAAKGGLGYIYGATECDTAKKMLEANKKDNDAKRNQISAQISSTKIIRDIEEYIPKKEETVKNAQMENTLELTEGLKNIDIVILGSIVGAVILLIIILMIILIKNKRRK